MWLIFALLSAVLASFRKVNDKQLTHKIHQLELAWAVKLTALPIIFIVTAFTHSLVDPTHLPARFWLAFIASAFVMTPLDTYLYLSSLKHGELSKIAPLLSLWPVVMLVLGALFLHETPNGIAIIAVLGIMTGVLVLNAERTGIGTIIRSMWSDRATRHGLIGVCTVSINTILGGIAIHSSGAIFYAFASSLTGLVVQYAIAKVMGVRNNQWLVRSLPSIALTGSMQGSTYLLYTLAVAAGPIAYVAAIRSSTSILSALLGVFILKESLTRNKKLAFIIIALSSAVLALKG